MRNVSQSIEGFTGDGMARINLSVLLVLFMVFATVATSQIPCNQPDTVGGGNFGLSSTLTDNDLGWDVGGGQCNGSFTVKRNTAFPGSTGDGLELGFRAERRSVGQVANNAGNYEVATGADPTNANRAWWNFQFSVGYDGNLNNLDKLFMTIRTDAGPSVPTATSFDLHSARPIIDDRNFNGTATYSDLYQISQNPVFAWFSAYDMNAPGAWRFTLVALENGTLLTNTMCVHTPGAVCAAPAPAYTCSAFETPMNNVITVKRQNRVLPLKMVCRDESGTVMTDQDIERPLVQVTRASGSVTDPDGADFISAGQGDDGNEFTYSNGKWQFNLSTRNFTGTGTYTITAVAGGGDLLVSAPTATFIVE